MKTEKPLIDVKIHWKDGSSHSSSLDLSLLKRKTYTAKLHDGSTLVVSYAE